MVAATFTEACSIKETRAAELEEWLADAKRQLHCGTDAVRRVDGDPDVLAAMLQRAETSRKRVAEIRRSLRFHEADRIPDSDMKRALVEFDEVWSILSSTEQPFKLLRKTSATLINSDERFRRLDSLFLGHAPSTIAEKHYSATADTALDAAIDYLRSKYQVEDCMQSA